MGSRTEGTMLLFLGYTVFHSSKVRIDYPGYFINGKEKKFVVKTARSFENSVLRLLLACFAKEKILFYDLRIMFILCV